MVAKELPHFTMNGYLLGSSFYRKDLQRGDVCFLLGHVNISIKLIFLITARSRTSKYGNSISNKNI
jgi:hypothetical protein